MTRPTFQGFPFLFIAALAMLLGGCGMPRPATDPMADQRAGKTALYLKNLNQHIITCKGTGRIVVRQNDQRVSYKIAWAAHAPDRLRLTFLASGFPVETVISTGEKVMFISHTGRHKPHLVNEADPDLRSVLDIPVTLSQVITLLTGRYHLIPFTDAYFDPQHPKERLLVLHNLETGDTQQLAIGTANEILDTTFFDFTGRRFLSIGFTSRMEVDGTQIPSVVNVGAGPDQAMRLTVHSFIVNPELKEGLFLLTGHGS